MADAKPTVCYRVHPGQASVIRVQQLLLAFRYRLRILSALALDSRHYALVPAARDRVIRCWEEHIEEVWAKRDMAGLRHMAEFGLKRRLLRRATWPYAAKALLPGMMVRLMDGRRQAED